jgi:N-acetylmuramoyl-L-alanine amidase
LIGTALPKRIMPAINVEDRAGGVDPSMLILHYTGMEDAERACNWLCATESRVSCHYLIDEAGVITQMVSEDKRAWHAGISSWQGTIDINSLSIGMEIQNPGHSGGYPDFPYVQMAAVAALSRDIIDRWSIDAKRVLAHSDIAPGRKVDPGEKFDWHYLYRQGIGHWVRPEPVGDDEGLLPGMSGESVSELQSLLRNVGYGVELTGIYDPQTVKAIDAFQRHFRQAKVNGIADISTRITLRRLAES